MLRPSLAVGLRFIILVSYLFAGQGIVPSASAAPATSPCIVEYTGNSTGRLLILLLGLNSSSQGFSDWQYLKDGLDDLYSGIVYFSYDENDAFGNYQREATGQSIWNHHIPVLESLISNCRARPDGFVSVDLIGHSMGGVVAFNYVLQHGLNGPNAGYVERVITLDSPVNGSWTLCSFNFPLSCYRPIIPSLGEAIEFVLGLFADSPAGEDMAGLYLSRESTIPINVGFAKTAKRIRGIEIYTFTNSQDSIILRNEAVIEGFGGSASLGGLDLSVGHMRVFQQEFSATVLSHIRPVLERPVEPNPNPTPEPTVPPPTVGSDRASFISDVTIPDGSIVAPGQALVKTWRVKNTGASTWDSGYKLVFESGDRIGAPNEIALPALAPNQEGNISLNITAPTAPGVYVGKWRLRNPHGTLFGDRLWVELDVRASSSAGRITVFDVSPGSPTNATQVHLVGRVKWFPEFRSMRFVAGNQYFEMPNFKQVGDQIEISTDWSTASLPRGEYALAFEVATTGDPGWANSERQIKPFTLTGTPASSGRPPDRPILKNPYNWYLVDNGGSAANVQMCVHPSSDPDGGTVQYYFDVTGPSNTNSGWTTSTCWSPSLGAGGWAWRVKAGDGTNESDWSSDTWNFNVATGDVSIGEPTVYQASHPTETHICVLVTYGGISGPEVRAWINTANDGSENGNWVQLDHYGPNTTPDCTSSNVHGFWLRSAKYTTGNHVIRISAQKPDNGFSATRTFVHNIPYMQPPEVIPVAPSTLADNGTWWNNYTIDFTWTLSLRTDSQTVRVSTSPDLWNDPSPLVNVALGASATSYSHTFAQDYGQLYWGVRATNGAGSAETPSGIWFGIDHVAPACTLPALPATTWDYVFQVNWSGTDDSAGIRSYDIQMLDSGRGEWRDWLLSVPATKLFDLFSGQPGHSYDFRCQSTDKAGNTGGYPNGGDTSIRIDPSTLPPTPWWDEAYAFKRNLTILNNMPALELPAGYPVRLRFDSGTSPTAAELYNASLTSTKCDDLRIVYDDTTELDRAITSCTNSLVEVWFRTQVAIGAASSNNTAHQVYLGHAGAGTPPANGSQVWYPFDEAGTTNLYFFQDGTGSTALDSSGNNRHCSINASVQWSQGRWANGLFFNRANSGDSQSLTCGTVPALSAFTIEFWYKAGTDGDGRIAGALSGGGNGGGGNNWLLESESKRIKLTVWPCGPCGSSDVKSNFELNQAQYVDRWNHIAVTFNGASEVKIWINGQLDKTGNLQASGINTFSPPLQIGSVEGISQLKGYLGALSISSGVKSSFPYAAFAGITTEPTTAAGAPLTPPIAGSPDLVVTGLDVFPFEMDSVLVQAVVQNQGTLNTLNGFFTDVYLNNVPVGPGSYTGTVQFWVNEPITAGASITLTTVLTDLVGLSGLALQSFGAASDSGFEEASGTLYAQVDSTGAVTEPDNQNNVYSAGTEVCVATADSYEGDDTFSAATPLGIGQTQTHNFSSQADEDWIKFTAQAGITYTLTTSELSISADTYLFLFDTDGATVLASNDDYQGSLASQIVWSAPADGEYYLLVKQWNPANSGCGTGYSLAMVMAATVPHRVFLPLVRQGSSAQSNSAEILFASDRNGNVEVYSMRSDGSLQTNRSNIPAMDGAPAWSPDGTKIAFVSDRDGHPQIYVMPASGGTATRLTWDPGTDSNPVWSPSGQQIAFQRGGEIWVINANGTNSVQLTNNSTFDGDPSWSPDGTKIAFESERNGAGNAEIYVMNANGSNPVRLTNHPAFDQNPVWSPDGAKIAFSTIRDGNFELYVMNANGTQPVRITNNSVADFRPTWSPDGRRIAFESFRNGNYDIFVIDATGLSEVKLTTNSSADRSPNWRR